MGQKSRLNSDDDEDDEEQEEKGKSKKKLLAGSESALGRSNDPVRIYLRKMGSVALLSREGEVVIAKKIEAAENLILEEFVDIKLGITLLHETAQKYLNDEIRMKSWIKG